MATAHTKSLLILFLLWVGCVVVVFPQDTNITFKNISTKDGLSQSTVTAIIKDKKGFMWFGTLDGLNKYDGYKFILYKHEQNNPSSIPSNHVTSLLEDSRGNLWIGTNGGGLSLFNRNTNSFTSFKEEPGNLKKISNNGVTKLFEDTKGNLWVGTYWGLNLFDRKTESFQSFYHLENDPESLNHNAITAITEDMDGNLWIGTSMGLNILDRTTFHCQRFIGNPENKSLPVIDLLADNQGVLWIATQNQGLIYYKNGEFTPYPLTRSASGEPAPNYITALVKDASENIWVGTESDGLKMIDRSQEKVYSYLNYYTGDFESSAPSVLALCNDDHGILWIGTYSNGISAYDRNKAAFFHYTKRTDSKGLNNNIVNAFVQADNQTVWIGTDGGGIDILNLASNTIRYIKADPKTNEGLNNNIIVTMMKGRDGNIWIGTYGGGVNLYDNKTRTFHYYVQGDGPGNLSNNHIYALHEDNKGRIWIGTLGGGLNMLDRKTGIVRKYFYSETDTTSIGNNFVSAVVSDRNGQVWIGTYGGGVHAYQEKADAFSRYQIINSELSKDEISVLYVDNENNLWIGTLGGGLNLFDKNRKKIVSFREQDGLSNDMINGIEKDNNGNLWISTNKGISKFNLTDKQFTNFDMSHGLQNDEFRRGAVLKTMSGEILFGGINGFNRFHPDSIRTNNNIPSVVFTDFQVFNKPVRVGGKNSPLQKHINEAEKIILNYDQSMFTIEFAALNYTVSERNQYAYKLTGFDKDWHYSANQQKATYTNLDPGTYTFHVIASNNDGIWNETGASIEIFIRPPFWKTWWFRGSMIILLAGIIFIAFKTRVKVIEQQKAQLEKEVNEKTTNLQKINKELDQFAYIVSHDLKAPLRGINALTGMIEDELGSNVNPEIKSYFKLMQDRTEKMKDLIDSILLYSRAGRTANKYESVNTVQIVQEVLKSLAIPPTFKVEIAPELPVIHFNETWMHQIFSNLISNAVKYHHREDGRISIGYKKIKGFHQFRVEDDGPGIEATYHEKIFVIFQTGPGVKNQDSTGVGLAIVNKIINDQGGKIWVESDGASGSKFIFEIPDDLLSKGKQN